MLSAGCSRSNLLMGSTIFRVRKLEKTEVTAATSKQLPKSGKQTQDGGQTVSVVGGYPQHLAVCQLYRIVRGLF